MGNEVVGKKLRKGAFKTVAAAPQKQSEKDHPEAEYCTLTLITTMSTILAVTYLMLAYH